MSHGLVVCGFVCLPRPFSGQGIIRSDAGETGELTYHAFPDPEQKPAPGHPHENNGAGPPARNQRLFRLPAGRRARSSGAWLLALGSIGLAAVGTACRATERSAGVTEDSLASHQAILDRPYIDVGGRKLVADLYIPRVRTGPVPVAIFFHGGGWVAGAPGALTPPVRQLLSLGWAVVLPEYRLAPADLAPAAIEDAVCVTRWVAREAERYGFDPRQLITAGYSAGGHLALMVGMLSGSNTFAHNCPGSPTPRPAFAMNVAGITDVAELVDGASVRDWAVTWVGQVQNRAAFIDSLSPITWIRPSSPPILSIHSTIDSTVPYGQASRFHAKLDENTVPNRLLILTQVGHDSMFSLPETRTGILEAMTSFARDHGVSMQEMASRR